VLVIPPGALGDVLLPSPALRRLRARHQDGRLVLAAQSHLGRLLVELGEVDAASAFEALGLEALFVENGEPVSVPAVSRAARVVCWFGSRDPTFPRRLREVAPSAVVASSAGSGSRVVWEHVMSTIGADGEAVRAPVEVTSELRAAGSDVLREAGWNGRRRVMMVHAGAGGRDKRRRGTRGRKPDWSWPARWSSPAVSVWPSWNGWDFPRARCGSSSRSPWCSSSSFVA